MELLLLLALGALAAGGRRDEADDRTREHDAWRDREEQAQRDRELAWQTQQEAWSRQTSVP